MKRNIFKYLVFVITLATTITSCRKDEFVGDNDLGDKGQTILKFAEGPTKTFLFEAFTNIKPISAFSLVRDVNSNESLSTASSVELVKAAVPAGYTFLPDNIFTLQTSSAAKFVKSANGFTVNFAPGVFAADFEINLNGALLDPTLKYAVAYTIGNTGGATVTAGTQKSITVVFTVLNKYDGMYSFQSVSQFNRYTNGVLNTGDVLMGSLVGLPNRAFTTIDGNTLTWTPVWANGGGVGGVDNFRLYVNPTTNQTTMTALGNATLKNSPGKPNYYDPATKTFYLNFEWGGGSAPGGNGRDMSVVLKYEGKRP
ncbi:hypothetical protein [Daejeonella sp.]|jgi:hypothetical protein|uniref:hypothetical protein n=1 Tax=Daejeonella sp. TaxID=2805397 RepID=UPI0037BF9780